MSEWVKDYEPETLDDVILPSRIRETLQLFLDKGTIESMLFSGSPGIGKSTCARILSRHKGHRDFYIVNCPAHPTISDFKKKIGNYTTSVSMFGDEALGKKIVVLEEADKLNKATLSYLMKIIEDSQDLVAWILTTNHKYDLPAPIISRCFEIEFNLMADRDDKGEVLDQLVDKLAEFAKRDSYPVDWEDKKVTTNLNKIFDKHLPDIRKIIKEVNFRCSPKGYAPIALSKH
jgi:DNA polymerase III delta prime subunit|tara:strand:+ start:1621 stop:2316 length:696 start_codon:yes stop_codon:yes gene_type:complete